MADVQQVMDVASKIVDATNNTQNQDNSIVPQGDTGNNNVQVVQGQTSTSSTQVERDSQTTVTTPNTTNDQIVQAAKTGLEQLHQTTPVQETPITTGTNSKLNSAYVKQVYEQVQKLPDFIKKLGMTISETGGKLYINNATVDWQSLGITKDINGEFNGTLEQYQQLINNVLSAGYTTALDFQNYAKELGFAVGKSADNWYTVNNKEVDFSQYTNLGMKILNGQWVGTEEAYKKIIRDIEERSDKTLVDSLNSQGFNAKIINNELYINNKKVDWKEYGLKKVFANVVGTDAQYSQVAQAISAEGYSKETLADFAKSQGLEVQQMENGLVEINGQLFDMAQYTDLGLENVPSIGWGGTEEAYNKIIEDANKRSQVTLDNFVKQQSMSFQLVGNDFYINNRKITKDELNTYGVQVINGQLYGTDAQFKKIVSDTKSQGYTTDQDFVTYAKASNIKTPNTAMLQGLDPKEFGLENINGQWVGSEAQYKELLDFVQNCSPQILGDYVKSQGESYIISDYKSYVNGKFITNDYMKSFGLKFWNGKIWGTQEQYDNFIQAIKDEGYTTSKDLGSYTGSLTQVGNNYTIDGKLVNLENYKQYGLTQIDGKWYGPESAFKKIEEDVAARSDSTLSQYLSGNSKVLEVRDGKVYANGTDVTKIINNSGLELINGEFVGTDDQYKAALAKIEEPYTYKSAFEEEIQNALDEIKNFQAYQTPQETLDLINQLVKSAQEKFSYNPAEDSALILAQKEAERQVREGSAGRGMLYSSGTMETATRKMAELIPQFEQVAYNRFQQEQNRVINVMNAVMQWDEMQADRNMDQFTLLTNKFNTLLDLDARGLEQFKVLLDQRNADKQYELELKQFQLDKKTQEVNQAWATVNEIGYVDEKTSAILGVPVGTKASWLKQVEEEQKNALALQAKQQEYDTQQQQKQYELDRALTEYKAQLDAANNERLQQQENEYNKKLAQQQANRQIAAQRPELKQGDTGNYVRTVQQHLANLGFDCPVDGNFGPKTFKAIGKYQQDEGLTPTGHVDAATWAKILDDQSGY